MSLRTSLMLVALFLAVSVSSAEEVTFKRILIPLFFDEPVAGAHGSRWDTELVFFNQGHSPVLAYSWGPGCRMLCPPDWGMREIPPGVTFGPDFPAFPTLAPTAFLFVDRERIADVNVQLRIRDLSRQSETWGTEIPTIPETDFTAGPISLLDVPVGNGFRTALRVYALPGPSPVSSSTVRVYRRGTWTEAGFTPDELLMQSLLSLVQETTTSPGYGQWLGLDGVPELAGVERVRIEVIPEAGTPMWAFASITHAETQHVTIVTPSRTFSSAAP